VPVSRKGASLQSASGFYMSSFTEKEGAAFHPFRPNLFFAGSSSSFPLLRPEQMSADLLRVLGVRSTTPSFSSKTFSRRSFPGRIFFPLFSLLLRYLSPLSYLISTRVEPVFFFEFQDFAVSTRVGCSRVRFTSPPFFFLCGYLEVGGNFAWSFPVPADEEPLFLCFFSSWIPFSIHDAGAAVFHRKHVKDHWASAPPF